MEPLGVPVSCVESPSPPSPPAMRDGEKSEPSLAGEGAEVLEVVSAEGVGIAVP